MSMDRSLKSGSYMSRHRNVLTRAERVTQLVAKKRFSMDGGDPLGLPKVGNRKVVTGGKYKKKTEEEGDKK